MAKLPIARVESYGNNQPLNTAMRPLRLIEQAANKREENKQDIADADNLDEDDKILLCRSLSMLMGADLAARAPMGVAGDGSAVIIGATERVDAVGNTLPPPQGVAIQLHEVTRTVTRTRKTLHTLTITVEVGCEDQTLQSLNEFFNGALRVGDKIVIYDATLSHLFKHLLPTKLVKYGVHHVANLKQAKAAGE